MSSGVPLPWTPTCHCSPWFLVSYARRASVSPTYPEAQFLGMKMTPSSLLASMVKPWKNRRHCDIIPHVHMQRSLHSDKSGDSSLPFLCPSPLPRLFFHISLSFHLPSPLSCCLFIFKALPPSPDCKAYKYSIFPRSSLWMIFHYSVSLTHPIRNGARLSSG